MPDDDTYGDLVQDLDRLRFNAPPFEKVFPAAPRSPRAIRLLQIAAALVLVGVLSVGVAAAAGLIKLPPDPEAGLSDAQRQLLHDRARADAAAFVRDFLASGTDLRSLPRRHESSFAGTPLDLPAGLSSASVVVVGTVTSIAITPADGLPHAVVSIAVERLIQGPAGQLLEVVQSGGPSPAANGGAELVDLESSPLLLPGDRVLLIAERMESGEFAGMLTPQAGTGVVYLVNGTAQPLPLSPAADALQGLPEADAISLYQRGGR